MVIKSEVVFTEKLSDSLAGIMKDIINPQNTLNLIYGIRNLGEPFILKDSVVHAMIQWKNQGY